MPRARTWFTAPLVAILLTACTPTTNDHPLLPLPPTTIEQASAEIEAASKEIRDMISHEFPTHQWIPAGGRYGKLVDYICDNPDTHAGYDAEMWSLRVRPSDEQALRIVDNIVEIGKRYGYTIETQPLEIGESVTIDLYGPHPESRIRFGYRDAIVIQAFIGCMPRQTPR